MKNIIGYIKFIDNDFIDDFFQLQNLWLSDIHTFTSNSEEQVDNLIDDKFEGKLDKLSLDMPAFITCFTEITSDSLDETGVLKKSISNALINCEEKLGKNRDFVFIPLANMQNALADIRDAELGKTTGYLASSPIFSRKVQYINDYKNTMDKLEAKCFEQNNPVSKESVGKGMLGIKSSKYQIQNEFRIGLVIAERNSDFYERWKSQKGLSLHFAHPINFAIQKFKRQELKKLNIKQMANQI